jgi:hypothetical protein
MAGFLHELGFAQANAHAEVEASAGAGFGYVGARAASFFDDAAGEGFELGRFGILHHTDV